MPTGKFAGRFKEHGELLTESLLRGTYQPQAVGQVEITEHSGGIRKLGVPTVTDWIIQQAIAQVLTPIYEFNSRSRYIESPVIFCQALVYIHVLSKLRSTKRIYQALFAFPGFQTENFKLCFAKH